MALIVLFAQAIKQYLFDAEHQNKPARLRFMVSGDDDDFAKTGTETEGAYENGIQLRSVQTRLIN
jgi:hypothetical protein